MSVLVPQKEMQQEQLALVPFCRKAFVLHADGDDGGGVFHLCDARDHVA